MKTREQKREEAEARHAERKARTPEQQLALLRVRGISSGREFERLSALVENGRGKLPDGEAPADKLVPEDTSTHPKRKTKAGKHAKG